MCLHVLALFVVCVLKGNGLFLYSVLLFEGCRGLCFGDGEDAWRYRFTSIVDVSVGCVLFVGLHDCICDEFSFLMNVV